MPITATEIQFRLSGGAANASGNASLGGEISANAAPESLNGLFDHVTGAEAAAGDAEYRCIYLRNGHASLTWYGVKTWIGTQSPAAGTAMQIGLGTSAVNGTEQTVADEQAAPVGVTFADAADEGAALVIGDIPAGQHKAIWVKRAVAPGAAAYNADGFVLSVKGDTAA